MNDTPETDAAFQANLSLPLGSNVEIPKWHPPCDPWELARKFESKNADLRKQLEDSQRSDWKQEYIHLKAEVESLKRQLAEARVPDGWKLVPVEPTEEMVAIGFGIHPCKSGESKVTDSYKAMLAAVKEPT